MTKKSSLLEGVDVLIADKGGVTMVGVPIGIDVYVLERGVRHQAWGEEYYITTPHQYEPLLPLDPAVR